jgi:hypothetical protein
MAPSNAHLRDLAAFADGMRCAYCQVPTAATIEHVNPRAKGGESYLTNLVLACPLCNSRKSTGDAEEFRASGRWRLEYPDDLPADLREMLRTYFGWESGMPYLRTGSPHARLRIKQNFCLLEIRPGKGYDWEIVNLGSANHPAVSKAAYDFLKRHFTPAEPKKYQRPGKPGFPAP